MDQATATVLASLISGIAAIAVALITTRSKQPIPASEINQPTPASSVKQIRPRWKTFLLTAGSVFCWLVAIWMFYRVYDDVTYWKGWHYQFPLTMGISFSIVASVLSYFLLGRTR